MLRRDLLRAAAAATALSMLPRDAHAIWARVATLQRDPQQTLSAAQAALVVSLADTIIPRTNTPGAIDVGVPAFLDVIVAEYMTEAERTAFVTGLDAIDALARSTGGAAFPALTDANRMLVMNALEKPADRNVPAVRSYNRLKGLVVHGYFTSERVQRDVLKTNIMPGKFEGNAPLRPRTGGGADAHQ